MTRLNLKFPVLAAAALCAVLAGCTSEEGSDSPGFTTTGGTGAVGGAGGTSGAGAGGVSGIGSGGTSGAGTGGVSGAGTGGASGDVGGASGIGGGGAGGMMAPAGAGGTMSGGTGGMPPVGGTGGEPDPDALAQCKADFVAAGDTMECADCACSQCATELDLCSNDELPAPNPNVTKTSGEVCTEIIECAGANNCSGDACWCGCTTGPGCCDTQYMMMGPCKFEINQGGSEPDFLGGGIAGPGQTHYPNASDKNPGPGHPIGNANVVGACIADKCAACQ